MKVFSTVCSIFLLGTIFSGVSMGMETEEKNPTHRQLSILNYTRPSDIIKKLSSRALDCDDLKVTVEGNIIEKRVDGDSEDSDDEKLIETFLKDLRNPPKYTYRHGVYSVGEAISEIARTDESTQLSPHHIHFLNTINSPFMVEAIEAQKGPMVCALLKLLQLCPNVEYLSLRFLPVNPLGIQALKETPRLSLLKMLEIQHASMDDDTVTMLLASPLPHLEYLALAHNAISGAGFSGASLPSLRILDLWHNKIGNDGLSAITKCHSPSLQTLSLGGNAINADGLRDTDWSDRNLEILLLDCNPIGDEGAFILSHPEYLPALKVLSLLYSEIEMEGLKALAARSSINIICVKGAKILEAQRKEFWGRNSLLFGDLRPYDSNGLLLTLDQIKAHHSHMF